MLSVTGMARVRGQGGEGGGEGGTLQIKPYIFFFSEVALHEMDDVLEINGQMFHKPFVEKPISAEDHNIYIYFPSDFGGGAQRLFRKVRGGEERERERERERESFLVCR